MHAVCSTNSTLIQNIVHAAAIQRQNLKNKSDQKRFLTFFNIEFQLSWSADLCSFPPGRVGRGWTLHLHDSVKALHKFEI